MNEQQQMIAEMADNLFADLSAREMSGASWDAVEAVGLPSLMVDAGRGGFGGSWSDAVIVFRLAGYRALALPVVEATIAAALADGAFDGRGTIAPAVEGTLAGDRFDGSITGAAWAEGAAYVVAPAPGGGSMILDMAQASVGTAANIAGEPRANLAFKGATAKRLPADIFALGALARAAQIAGALDASLAMSVAYVNERKQFGRPLAKFQAVQQSLATFACEAAAANCAALGAAQAQGRGDGDYAIAAAKLRANRAVGVGTALAHQVHGAIGFTHEYPLHPLTRRLWAWRSEFGGDSHWSGVLGDRICARGADQFWADLTAVTD